MLEVLPGDLWLNYGSLRITLHNVQWSLFLGKCAVELNYGCSSKPTQDLLSIQQE